MKLKMMVIIILILVGALAGYVTYAMIRNSPVATVRKVLELRNNYNENKAQIAAYATGPYLEAEKEPANGLNSPLCALSLKNQNANLAEVSCEIKTAKDGRITGTEAAVFYLKRSGFFPFRYRYLIDNVVITNPILAAPFSDLAVKKTDSQEYFGTAFSAGELKINFADFRFKERRSSEDLPQIVDYTFSLDELNGKNLGEYKLFFQVVAKDGTECAPIQLSEEPLGVGGAVVRLLGYNGKCLADSINLFGPFDSNYTVKIK